MAILIHVGKKKTRDAATPDQLNNRIEGALAAISQARKSLDQYHVNALDPSKKDESFKLYMELDKIFGRIRSLKVR